MDFFFLIYVVFTVKAAAFKQSKMLVVEAHQNDITHS